MRSYSTSPQLWGGDQSGACAHEWNHARYYVVGGGLAGGSKEAFSEPGEANAARIKAARWHEDDTCLRCGCWRGELGSEPTPEQFIANLVEVFAAVKRVLRDDGTLWVNLGDSYAGSGKGPTGHNGIGDQETRQGFSTVSPSSVLGSGPGTTGKSRSALRGSSPSGDLPAKSLLMMPARVALALQANGWILRSCMPWIKASAMPESVQDRPSSALEYVFLFSKKARYFYDSEAVRQGWADDRLGASGARSLPYSTGAGRHDTLGNSEKRGLGVGPPTSGRAFRNTDLFRQSVQDQVDAYAAVLVRLLAFRDGGGLLLDEDGDPLALDVNPAAFKESHFATFPPKLVEPLIKAGTSERGACPTCGAAWVRVVERGHINTREERRGPASGEWVVPGRLTEKGQQAIYNKNGQTYHATATTLDWQPSCRCDAGEPQPQTVLDPFSGAGTTGLVASRLGRDYLGVELSPIYAAMSEARIRDDAPLLAEVVTAGAVEYTPLELFGEESA